MFIAINPYGPSNSVNLLRDALTEEGMRVKKLKREGSRYSPRDSDLIVNWGSSRPMSVFDPNNSRHLNNPAAVNLASNKIECLRRLTEQSVSTVDWTTNASDARRWVEEGATVFCRTELRGHSGSGIVCVANREPENLGPVDWQDTLPNAPLYTKGVDRRHREYRVHVIKGHLLFVQQKRRAAGYRDNPNYSNVVRNHGNGWVYSHLNMTSPNRACISVAKAAVEAVGLDFGAVDVITNGEDAWVLEINTAPGLYGDTTLARYKQAFLNLFAGNEATDGIEMQALRPFNAQEVWQDVVSQVAAMRGVPFDQPDQPLPEMAPPPPPPADIVVARPRDDGFYIVEVNGQRDVAWKDGTLYFTARNFGGYPEDRVTVIRPLEVS